MTKERRSRFVGLTGWHVANIKIFAGTADLPLVKLLNDIYIRSNIP